MFCLEILEVLSVISLCVFVSATLQATIRKSKIVAPLTKQKQPTTMASGKVS